VVSTASPDFEGFNPTATTLLDGRILVTAGSAALHDPTTGLFTPPGPMLPIGHGRTAMLLRDGRVPIASCCDVRAIAQLYDPATGTFTSTRAMTAGRAEHSATLLSDGQILLAGGITPKIGEDPWIPLATASSTTPRPGPRAHRVDDHGPGGACGGPPAQRARAGRSPGSVALAAIVVVVGLIQPVVLPMGPSPACRG